MVTYVFVLTMCNNDDVCFVLTMCNNGDVCCFIDYV